MGELSSKQDAHNLSLHFMLFRIPTITQHSDTLTRVHTSPAGKMDSLSLLRPPTSHAQRPPNAQPTLMLRLLLPHRQTLPRRESRHRTLTMTVGPRRQAPTSTPLLLKPTPLALLTPSLLLGHRRRRRPVLDMAHPLHPPRPLLRGAELLQQLGPAHAAVVAALEAVRSLERRRGRRRGRGNGTEGTRPLALFLAGRKRKLRLVFLLWTSGARFWVSVGKNRRGAYRPCCSAPSRALPTPPPLPPTAATCRYPIADTLFNRFFSAAKAEDCGSSIRSP